MRYSVIALMLLASCNNYHSAAPNAPKQGLFGLGGGRAVYEESECIGAVVMGKCHGSVLPNASYHKKCHGEMLNGTCTGPLF